MVKGELIDMGFQKKVAAAIKAVKDLRPAFLSITSDWYRDNKQIFMYDKTMNYEPLSDKYKKNKVSKARRLGLKLNADGKPILRFTGRLETSITVPKSEGSVHEITKTHLTLGTEIPYAIYHQSTMARSVLPYRPIIINSDVKQGNATAVFAKRTKRYTRILDEFVKRQVKRSQGGA